MDHVAIMKASWKMVDKILRGEKTIESRWFSIKAKPWDSIFVGDVIYFKESSRPVTARATVSKIEQYEDLNPSAIRDLLRQYAKSIAVDAETFFPLIKEKRRAILIHLKDPQTMKPFEINKRGFGTMCAWLTIDDINRIKV